MKNKFNIAILLLTTAFLSASEANAQQTFQLSFQGFWTSDLPRPGSAHFSPLVGATHSGSSSLFQVGQLASQGVENVAELGSTSAIIGEINTLINAGNAGQLLLNNVNIGPVQTVSQSFTTTRNYNHVSLLTMIAPSPDWFVGVDGLDLLDENGNWKQQIVLDLNSYDAGTEEGSSFSLSNPPTSPREPISMLDTAEPNNPLAGAASIARLIVTRTTPAFDSTTADSAIVRFGNLNSGGVPELSQSDDLDLSASRSTTDIQSRIFVELTGEAPASQLDAISLDAEASVFARSQVNQSIDFWNYETSAWENVESGVATRFSDSTMTATASGNASRFVDPISNEVRARIRFESVSQRQRFTANVDHVIWNTTY